MVGYCYCRDSCGGGSSRAMAPGQFPFVHGGPSNDGMGEHCTTHSVPVVSVVVVASGVTRTVVCVTDVVVAVSVVV